MAVAILKRPEYQDAMGLTPWQRAPPPHFRSWDQSSTAPLKAALESSVLASHTGHVRPDGRLLVSAGADKLAVRTAFLAGVEARLARRPVSRSGR